LGAGRSKSANETWTFWPSLIFRPRPRCGLQKVKPLDVDHIVTNLFHSPKSHVCRGFIRKSFDRQIFKQSPITLQRLANTTHTFDVPFWLVWRGVEFQASLVCFVHDPHVSWMSACHLKIFHVSAASEAKQVSVFKGIERARETYISP
jgi:hypothetical protein